MIIQECQKRKAMRQMFVFRIALGLDKNLREVPPEQNPRTFFFLAFCIVPMTTFHSI
jgi:hypothetical protein